MKYCPECSLKIRSNLTDCPICKVTLTHSTDDEDINNPLQKEAQAEDLITRIAPPLSTKNNPHSVESTNTLNKQHMIMNSAKADDADQANRIKNLENALKVIEDKLTTALNQSDLFKNTVIELGTIVTKVDKSLKAVKQSLSDPNQRIQHIEEDLSGLSLQIKDIKEDVAHAQHTIKNLDANKGTSTSPYEANKDSVNFLSGKIEISDEGIKFPEGVENDFGTAFETPIIPPEDDFFFNHDSEKKNNRVIISAIAVLITLSFILFYYFKSEDTKSQNDMIAQQIEIPPIPQKKANHTPPSAGKKGPAQNIVVTERETPSSSKSGLKNKKNDRPVITPKVAMNNQQSSQKNKIPAPPVTKNLSGYTINVASFKDKKRALDYTKKLSNKGYPVLMLPSKNMFRVKVGAFSTLQEARVYAANLNKKEKINTFISSIK
jgi:cell division septation protein DedD